MSSRRRSRSNRQGRTFRGQSGAANLWSLFWVIITILNHFDWFSRKQIVRKIPVHILCQKSPLNILYFTYRVKYKDKL
jgi:hypothetical protein